MLKRISITFISLVAFAIFALLAATAVKAQVDDWTDCPAPPIDSTYASWTCNGLGVDYNGHSTNSDRTTFSYTIRGDNPSHFSLLIPSPIAETIVNKCDESVSTNCWATNCDGNGDSSTDHFGKGFKFLCTAVYTWSSWSGNSKDIDLTLQGVDYRNYPTESLLKKSTCRYSSCDNNGPATFGCDQSGWGAIQGPAQGCVQIEPNQPLAGGTTITQSGYTFNILYDANGQSYDVVCPPGGSCSVDTVNIEDLRLYVEGDPIATVTWLPYDTPLQSAASPGCTYVRTRSGGLKKVCD